MRFSAYVDGTVSVLLAKTHTIDLTTSDTGDYLKIEIP